MSDLDVRIEELEPMRVASVRAVSENPEHDAWKKLKLWADAKEYLGNVEEHPIFGFNNPNPSPDRKEYGYEFWLRVPLIQSQKLKSKQRTFREDSTPSLRIKVIPIRRFG